MALKPCEGVIWTETKTKTEPSEEENNTKPRFQSKKGSVFPAKRRSVKKMMFDQFVKSVAFLFASTRCSPVAGALKPDKG